MSSVKLNGNVNTRPTETNDEGVDDDEPLLIPGVTNHYKLPKLRYSNIFLALVFIDGITSIALWLTGGNSDYFVDNIVHFHFKESVFDLALMASLKVLLIGGVILAFLENMSYLQIDQPFNSRLKKNIKLLHVGLVLLTFAFFAFTACKGGFILNAVVNQKDYRRMHNTYNGLVIFAFCISLIELLFGLYSFTAMKKLKVIRILHRYNDDGVEVDKEGKVLKKKVDIGRLASLAKPEAGLLSVATVGLLFATISQTIAPLYFGKVVDSAQTSMDELTKTVLILLGIYVVGSVFAMLRSWMFELSGMRLVARLRKKLFVAIIQQEVAFFDVNRTGELCNRLSSDTQVIQKAVTNNMSMLVRYILQLIGSLGFMFYLNAALTGVLLAIVPIVSLSAVKYGSYVKKLSKQFQDKLGEAGTVAEESLSSLRTVRTFSAEPKAGHLYGVEIDHSYKIGKKLSIIVGTFTGGISLIAQGAVTVVLWYGGKLVYDNSHGGHTGLTPGVLTSFLLYTLQVAMCFSFLSALYGDFMQAVGASVRIFELLDRKPEVSNDNGTILAHVDGRVEFKDVTFTYPSRKESKVLKGVSFTLEPGEVLALVGPSGGGKSTIVSLIERFYDPDSGTVTLGGRDLKELDPQWFRQKISMVSQEPTLFACSIKENIAYGRSATDQEIEEAARRANAHEFITSFEEGYDTMVGERGVRLSGGQKQRIAIARALIMDPILLLLDEATSALDAESEHLVQEAIERAMKGRTVIVIAHRLSTVRNATKVIVIDKGSIAEQGTHDELIEKNGVYKRLVLRQLMAGSLGREDTQSLDENDSIDSKLS